MRLVFIALLITVCSGAAFSAPRELIGDPHFQNGFILWNPKPGQHVRYGTLAGPDGNMTPLPVWGLSQWSSKFPLEAAATIRTNGFLICSNAAKGIVSKPGLDFAMAINSFVEYGPRARVARDPWVHLLVEQEFSAPAPLAKLSAARLHIESRLLRSTNLHRGDYSAGLHAAQFQIFFTIQNRNRQSKGFGDMLWFGIPIYDNRHRFPQEFKARDFGGTAKFIFTPGGTEFTTLSAHDREWITIDKDLLPLMREALKDAWKHGLLKDSRTVSDYFIGGMNMGWELPGSFDVEMQVRNLSLKLQDSD